MKIRSITLFADVPLPITAAVLAPWGDFVTRAQRAFIDAGFEVQTTRLATDLFPRLSALAGPGAWLDIAVTLEAPAREHGFEYVSLGPANLRLLPAVPELLAATRATFVTARLLDPATGGIDGDAVRACARVIQQAAHIEKGFGNLRFAALAHVPPGVPFFPAAYHAGGPPTFALAMQAADLAVLASSAPDAESARLRLVDYLEAEAARLLPVAECLAHDHGIPFTGIDFSLAPFPSMEYSIGAALEMLTGQPLGASGTLAAAATLASALDQARFPHAGFCGLMLPVLEDPVLAARAAEGRLSVGELLQWSAVCGTGLDTVPLPGDADKSTLARLLFDVATLAARARKPLTARLMPLPGKVAGDPVHFDFAYFADGGVLALPGTAAPGRLTATSRLHLAPRAA